MYGLSWMHLELTHKWCALKAARGSQASGSHYVTVFVKSSNFATYQVDVCFALMSWHFPRKPLGTNCHLGVSYQNKSAEFFDLKKKCHTSELIAQKDTEKKNLKQACRDTCKFSHITIAGWELKSWIPWLTPQWVRLRAPLIFAHVTEPWRLEHTSCVLCVFSTCFVTYSTEADIKTVMKPWYDVDVTVYRLFSGLQIHASVMVKIGATLNL